jgi:hypothetical protein
LKAEGGTPSAFAFLPQPHVELPFPVNPSPVPLGFCPKSMRRMNCRFRVFDRSSAVGQMFELCSP